MKQTCVYKNCGSVILSDFTIKFGFKFSLFVFSKKCTIIRRMNQHEGENMREREREREKKNVTNMRLVWQIKTYEFHLDQFNVNLQIVLNLKIPC